MYKFIYAHVLYTQVNLLKRSHERERKERGEKKEKKLPPPTKLPSLHHRKFETGRSASFDHLKKVVNVLFSLSERIFSFQIRLNISFFQSRHTHTRARLLSQESPTPRALKQSRTKTTSLFSSHTQNTPQSKKDVLLYHFHRRENRPKINPPKAIG